MANDHPEAPARARLISSFFFLFPHKELVFVCRDTNPDPESGIMVKKVAWPFVEGGMIFHLAPDASVKHVAYFNITRYDSKNPD